LAVAHAHTNLVIHRDLKPSNVYVTHDGGVKLLDFGIARLIDAGIDESFTRHEDTVLTPEYCAPEQLLGDAPSTATDVYQLGMLLYVLLTGRHPLTLNGSRAERVKAALDGQVPRASEFAEGPLRRQLRGDLDAILAKAMRRDPRERYATAAALREDLVRYLRREPVYARRGAALYVTRKFVIRHQGSVMAGVIVLVTLFSAMIATRVQLTESREQRASALVNARRAETTKEFLQLVLNEFESRGEALTTKKLLERSTELLRTQYADQPKFISEMLLELADEYAMQTELTTEDALLNEALEIARGQRLYDLVASAECEMARLKSRRGLRDEALVRLKEGENALALAPDAKPEIVANCLYAKARLFTAQGDHQSSIHASQQARSILEKNDATRGIVYNDVLSALLSDYLATGRMTEALATARLCVESHVRNGRGGTRREMTSRENLSTVLYRLGEIREARAILSEMMERALSLNSADDLSTAIVVNASIATNRLKIPNPWLRMFENAIARAEKEGAIADFRAGSAGLARTKFIAGRPRDEVEAPILHLESMRVAGKSVVAPVSRVVITDVRVDLDIRDGDTASAARRAHDLLDELAAANFKEPRSLFLAHSIASRAALANGDVARAEAEAKIALAIVEPIARGVDTSADVGDALLYLSRALIAQKRDKEARPLLERAARSLANGYGVDHPATLEAQRLLQ
jgi:tetratricopeptide (TPR) repeat protein